ncbi:UNVERIFIED_ORG: hypothetical protein ABID57_000685 [Arthrobacter sp. UYEF1]
MNNSPLTPSSGELEQWAEAIPGATVYRKAFGKHLQVEIEVADLQLYIATTVTAAEQRGEQNGVAWAIGVIDELHIGGRGAETTDRLFKGIKNNLRDRFKAVTGIDPAPSYPVNAALKQTQPSKEQANG